jgi:hypothetical protein
MSDIFYSQVEPQVADELQARAAAGKNRRSDKELQFILGKVANISIEAYEQDFLLSSNRSDQQPMANGVIGGRTVTNSSFLPTGPNGYLNNVSRRIPPVITAGSISISDASLGALNEATVNILVSDINGFEDFEQVFLRPGRNIIMRLEHPESALLTENAVIQVKQPKRQLDTEASSSALSYDTEPQKLNQVKFEGLITTFNTTWNADATITVTLNIRGRTSTFADIHLSQFSNASENEQKKESPTFSTSKYKLYESGSKTNPNNRTIITTITQDFEEVRNNSTNGSDISGTTRYLWGELFPVEDNDKSKKEDVISKFISLSTIIQKILVIIGSSGLSGKTVLDVGTLRLFDQTNGYEQLKSADPTRVLLYQGTSQVESSTYAGQKALPWVKPVTDGFIRNKIGYLENIFISITELEQIYKALEKSKTITVKDFLNEISDTVKFLTGDAINLKLVPITIQGEQTESTQISFDILYFLDSNYEGSPQIKSDAVVPTKIPMFANNVNGTAVRNFNIKMQLPKSAASLAYVLNSDPAEISEESVAPFVSYMYADEERKQQLEERFKELNKVATDELANAEKQLMQETTSDSIRRMINALKQYLKFPTNDIKTSNQLGRPIFDIEAEFEIDGLNGFRFGDVLDFDGIPPRYREEAVFIIYNVTHNVKSDGEWITTIRTRLRTKIS